MDERDTAQGGEREEGVSHEVPDGMEVRIVDADLPISEGESGIPNEAVSIRTLDSFLSATMRERVRNYAQHSLRVVQTGFVRTREVLTGHKGVVLAVCALVVLGVVATSIDREQGDPAWYAYDGGYRLVPETLSASASIGITLPDEVPHATNDMVHFSPEIPGSFIVSGDERVLRYEPEEPLTVGSHYRVTLAYANTTLAEDFLVADDPMVVSILPTSDGEVHEESELSVVFNRPMVPLTTRAEMDSMEVPVRLEPEVQGVWKWKSTRLLQFIPTNAFTRATTYTVTVNEGFKSLDGVSVPGFTHTFTTRTLKHHPIASEVRFDAPLEIAFNQPVDIEKTARELVFTKNGTPVEPLVSYAKKEEKRGFFGLVLFGKEDEVDTSKVWVRPLKDTHGREGYWDFGARYTIALPKQYPMEGNLVSDEGVTWEYTIPEVLSSLSAVSERSPHVTPLLFDPEGELVATFFEPVDIKKTRITVPGFKEARYGKQCVTDADGKTVKDPQTKKCKEEDNKHEIRIRVDSSAYPRGNKATITFEQVVHEEGLVLTTAPIVRPVHTIPEFAITRIVPTTGTTTASLTDITFCSTVPISRPERLRDALRTEGYVVYPDSAWQESRLPPYSQSPCALDEFQTTVRYGLHPNTSYEFSITLNDPFGGKTSFEHRMTTGPAPSMYTRFQSMQKWYNVTVPGSTRLTYALENLPAVAVHMCKVTPETMLRLLDGLPIGNKIPSASLCTEVRTTIIDVPDTYWVNHYFNFDIADYFADSRGHFIITFTHATYRNEENVQQYEHTLLSVSNLTVGEKRTEWHDWYSHEMVSARRATVTPQNLYWVLGAQTLDPIRGVQVVSYKKQDNADSSGTLSRHTEGETGPQGIARLPATQHGGGATFVFGGDTAVVSPAVDTLAYEWGSGSESRTYLYTDRPLYRPGDTVHVKGIDRVGYDQVWRLTEGYEATVRVGNSRGDTIYEQKVPVSLYGTFDVTFTLPPDAPLGSYNISAMENGYGWFEVEEYVGAPFKVEVTPEKEEYVAGDTATVAIDARYYFDMPLADAHVEYTVLAQDYYFDRYRDEYFSFGAGWYTCYWCGYGDTFITRGTRTLDAEGKGSIAIPFAFLEHFDEPEKAGSKLYTVIARVSDRSGKQVVGQTTMIVHRGEHYLGVKTEPYMSGVGEDATIKIKTVDTQGKPIPLTDVTVVAEKITWESYKRREVDGGYYSQSEEVRTPVFTRTVRTDSDGNHSFLHAFSEAGSYAITVTRADSRGNIVSSEAQAYVWGSGSVSVRPTNNASLTVVADKPSYRAGETATILAESPFPRGRALVTVERGDVYEYYDMPITGGFVTQKLTLRDTYAPMVHASVLLVGPGPEVKYGSVPLTVDSDAYTLQVEVEPNKRAYLPGEDVVLTVHTRDARGTAVPAEVSVAVVDMSVLALVGNPKKDPVSFFYGGVPLGVSTAHSAKNRLIETDIPVGTKGGGGGDDLARRKRGIFKDTAYWSARVTTDSAGVATVRFTLPDNLTTWQVESLGVTEDTKLGVQYTEFTSKKPLMAIPIRPRFTIPGDTMLLGMQVMNNTEETVSVRTRITSPTLTITDTSEQTVRVPSGGQEVVYFATEAPRQQKEGAYVVTFHAVHDTYEDVVEAVVPIRENRAYEVVATAGMTDSGVFESVYVPEYAGEDGELTVQAQSTLVASMLGAVKDMAEYPYGCSEQIASRLASLATVRRVGTVFGAEAVASAQMVVYGTTTYPLDTAIAEGLRELLERQQYDGGFTFYPGTDPSVYLTVEILSALTTVREAGYTVSDSVFINASEYIVREVTNASFIDNGTLARVAYALSSPYVPAGNRTSIAPRVKSVINDPLALEQLDTTALAYLALATMRTPYTPVLAEELYASLQNRLVVDARGAYMKGLRDEYSWFESPEKNTALFVRLVAERGGEHAVLDNTLRWLQRAMRYGGGWGSTNATVSVLDAVLRLAEVRDEHTAVYDLLITKEGKRAGRFAVNDATRFNMFTHVFPLSSFSRNRIERIGVRKENERDAGTIYYDMQLRYSLPPEMLPPRDEGFTVERALYARNGTEAVHEATVGDMVIGKVTVTVPKVSRAVSVESFVPAGFEIVNMGFATEESRDLAFDEYGNEIKKPSEAWWWYDEPTSEPRAFPITYEELHDDRAFVFAEEVRPGIYVYEYTLRALVPGTYTHMPATVSEMYTPENFGRSDAGTFVIHEGR